MVDENLVADSGYHSQIDEERQYWKHKFYVATEGVDVANRTLKIDRETQRGRNG